MTADQGPNLISNALLAVFAGGAATALSWVAVNGFTPAEAASEHPAPVTRRAQERTSPALYIDGRRVQSLENIRFAEDAWSPASLRKTHDALGPARYDYYRELRERASAAALTGADYDGPTMAEITEIERRAVVPW